jgi:hypothetical protein
MKLIHLLKTAAAVTWAAAASSASAAITININEVGSDVVATASGTANTSSFAAPIEFPVGVETYIFPSSTALGLLVGDGSIARTWDYYQEITTVKIVFGIGNFAYASSSTGDVVGITQDIDFMPGDIYLPVNYVSGTALSGSSTWLGQSIASLGLYEGSYTWHWGSGANADSLTLNISASAPVPEPETYAMLLAGTRSAGCGGAAGPPDLQPASGLVERKNREEPVRHCIGPQFHSLAVGDLGNEEVVGTGVVEDVGAAALFDGRRQQGQGTGVPLDDLFHGYRMPPLSTRLRTRSMLISGSSVATKYR